MTCQNESKTLTPSPSESAAAPVIRPPSKRHAEIMECSEEGRAKFWRSVSKAPHPKGCWIWTGSKDDAGYALIRLKKRAVIASRLSYFLANGNLDETLHVCHTCDNPPCVNPAHLFLGTLTDNVRDCTSKGRHAGQKKTHCPKGHEYTPENILHRKDRPGVRSCRACRLEYDKKIYQRRKLKAEQAKLNQPSNDNPD